MREYFRLTGQDRLATILILTYIRQYSMSIERGLENARSLFHEFAVDVAYLYGSRACGRGHADSDVDVAVLLHERDGHPNVAKLERRLSEHLDETVDCRVLNEADPRFIYTVLRTGQPVYVHDEDRRREFEHRSMRTYLDMKPFLDEYDRYVRSRMTA